MRGYEHAFELVANNTVVKLRFPLTFELQLQKYKEIPLGNKDYVPDTNHRMSRPQNRADVLQSNSELQLT